MATTSSTNAFAQNKPASAAIGATQFVDNVRAANLIREIWSSKSAQALENALIIANFVNREFEGEVKMGNRVRIPTYGNLNYRSRALTTAGQDDAITFDAPTPGYFQLTIDTQDYAAFAVTLVSDIQSDRNIMEMYTPKLGYALAERIDIRLATYFSSFTNARAAYGSSDTSIDLGIADYRTAMLDRDVDNIPRDGLKFVLSPEECDSLMSLSLGGQAWAFANRDWQIFGQGGQTADATRGFVSTLRGIPVYCSNNLVSNSISGLSGSATGTSHDNALMHPDSITLAMQQAPTTYTDWDINYLVTKVAQVNLHGSGIFRNDFGYRLRGR